MTGIVLAIYASFFVGLSQAILKKSYREFSPSIAFAFDAMFGLLLWVPLALVLGIHKGFLLPALPYAVLSAIFSEALVFYVLSKGKLSITAALIGSYSIYTVLFSFLFNGEHLTEWQLISVAITILGTVIVYLPSKFSWAEIKNLGPLLWPLLAAAAIGFSDAISKNFINQSKDYSFLFMLALVQVPVALVYLRIQNQHIGRFVAGVGGRLKDYKQAIGGSLFNIVGTGFLWLSFSFAFASIASPITATSGAVVALFAIFLMDEDITWQITLGLLLVFAGIIGISLTV